MGVGGLLLSNMRQKRKLQKGHDKWIKKMTAKELPRKLKDVSTMWNCIFIG